MKRKRNSGKKPPPPERGEGPTKKSRGEEDFSEGKKKKGERRGTP